MSIREMHHSYETSLVIVTDQKAFRFSGVIYTKHYTFLYCHSMQINIKVFLLGITLRVNSQCDHQVLICVNVV